MTFTITSIRLCTYVGRYITRLYLTHNWVRHKYYIRIHLPLIVIRSGITMDHTLGVCFPTVVYMTLTA